MSRSKAPAAQVDVVEPEAVEVEQVELLEPEATEDDEQDEQDDDAPVVIRNLQANPVRVLGLTGHGECVLTDAMRSNAVLMARLERGIELGLFEIV